MRYTMIIDDARKPAVEYREAETAVQARAELAAYMHENPESTSVIAHVGEPGDESPRFILHATQSDTTIFRPTAPASARA